MEHNLSSLVETGGKEESNDNTEHKHRILPVRVLHFNRVWMFKSTE